MSDKKILKDSEVPGGEGRRTMDHYLSEKLGGYKSEKQGDSFYGNYVEPILHATEHTARAIYSQNGKEWARAKDELNSVGNGGLSKMDNHYQREYTKK